VYYIVKNEHLYNGLPKEKTVKFTYDSFWGQIREVRNLIKKLSITIVLLNGGATLFFVPFIQNISKTIMYRHTTNLCVNIYKRIIYIVLLHFCYLLTEKIIHVSKYSMSEQLYFKNKAVCIHNGVYATPVITRMVNKPVKFLFLGRTDVSKGIDLVVQVFQYISHKKAILDIVGSGAYEKHLQNLNVTNIKYHGFQTDIDKYYHEADVFILMTNYENCPFSVIDALRTSMPVITTGAGGISEMVFNNKNGLVIDKTIDSLISAINT